MRLRAGVGCCLLLYVMVLLLPVITTAQTDQEIIQRIAELEQWIRDHPGVFNWNVHNELRHLYLGTNPPDLRKSMEHSNVILQHSVMDGYILNILSGWQIDTDTVAARANLLMNAQAFPDLRFIAAACFLKIGDLYTEEGNLEEATSFYLMVAEDNSPDMAQYRILAEERLSQQGQPPAAPSNVQAEEITHEGRLSTEVSWTDNADNELGYVVVDQNRPQRYEADPVPGIGAIGSLILPFVSSFCVYAYNDYGISDAVCTDEVDDSFSYPMDQSSFTIDYNINNSGLTRTSECYGVPLSNTWHAGEDWFAPASTPVKAVADGVVKYSSKPGSGGTITYPGGVVIIEHSLPDQSLIYSMYAHLDPSRILVPKEAKVTKGQKIADGLCHEGDCAGNVHLHWEMRFFLDGSGINKATTEPPYTQTCSQVPGPGYTYPGHPDNFVANGGAGPTYHWTDPSSFVDTH